MLNIAIAALVSAGVTVTSDIIQSLYDLAQRSLDVARAEALYKVALIAGAEDAERLGGNAQEYRQRVKNMLAHIERYYPAKVYAVIVGLVTDIIGGAL